MPFVPFKKLMDDAENHQYAVGYFESWNLESLLAVCDAAEAMKSPVIIGFSGINLPDYEHVVKNTLSLYSTLATEACKKLSVPVCTIFNESPYFDLVMESIDCGFGLVMFTNDELSFEEQIKQVKMVVDKAHKNSIAVEGEIMSPSGLGESLINIPEEINFTNIDLAKSFVKQTGVDSFAVNIGQVHTIGDEKVHLDFSSLEKLKENIPVPLVLHGASSVYDVDIVEAIKLGIRKINVGKVLKQTYFEALKSEIVKVNDDYNPYQVVGSGLDNDVLNSARVELQKEIEGLMKLFRSKGKA
ncbi:MAG: class II fructose-bisphosphate aldolase [Actinobacteria bacterium]|nr:class II fructose-bisphosphate aldolase [Actinomycetota bacterium]